MYVQRKANITKLEAKYVGLMRVIKKLGVIYWCKDLVTHKCFKVHMDRLKVEEAVSNLSKSTRIIIIIAFF